MNCALVLTVLLFGIEVHSLIFASGTANGILKLITQEHIQKTKIETLGVPNVPTYPTPLRLVQLPKLTTLPELNYWPKSSALPKLNTPQLRLAQLPQPTSFPELNTWPGLTTLPQIASQNTPKSPEVNYMNKLPIVNHLPAVVIPSQFIKTELNTMPQINSWAVPKLPEVNYVPTVRNLPAVIIPPQALKPDLRTLPELNSGVVPKLPELSAVRNLPSTVITLPQEMQPRIGAGPLQALLKLAVPDSNRPDNTPSPVYDRNTVWNHFIMALQNRPSM